MTQEEKQLLLKDLCMRIPYRTFVCLNPGAYNKPETCILTGVHNEHIHLNVDSDPFRIDHIKPYLRPMSSMTEEEVIEYLSACDKDYKDSLTTPRHSGADWLNAHHFDYRGLIPMGLALEAKEGMYND